MHTTLKAARRSLSRDSMASKGKKECSGELCTCTVQRKDTHVEAHVEALAVELHA